MHRVLFPCLALLVVGSVGAVTVLRAQGQAAAAPGSALVGARFSNDIVAIVEDHVITVGDIRRSIGPLLPQIRAESRTEAEFRKNIEASEDRIIQKLVDEWLLVKTFRSEGKYHIPAALVDKQIEENLGSKFGGDRSKFHAYLRSIGKTHREYRQMVEERMIMDFVRGEKTP